MSNKKKPRKGPLATSNYAKLFSFKILFNSVISDVHLKDFFPIVKELEPSQTPIAAFSNISETINVIL